MKIKYFYFVNNTVENMHDIGYFFINTVDYININSLKSISSDEFNNRMQYLSAPVLNIQEFTYSLINNSYVIN